jgi:hypothetical protein
LTAWLATRIRLSRKKGRAVPHPVSGAASAYFCAAVESPAMKSVRLRPPADGPARAAGAAAAASGRLAAAATT